MVPNITRFAVTTWQGRVAPVFDVCRQLLVLEVRDGAVVGRSSHAVDAEDPFIRAARVVELCGSTLICGAISEPVARWIRARGVEVLGFVAGEVDDIVRACVAGELPCHEYAMPGCPAPPRRQRVRRRARDGSGPCGRTRR